MKKFQWLYLTVLSVLCVSLISCGGDGKDEPTPPVEKELSLSQSEVEIDAISGQTVIDVLNAKSTISAISSDEHIATCKVQGNKLEIQAFLVGEATITVSSNNKSVKCKVVVNPTLNHCGNPVLKFGASQDEIKKLIKGKLTSEKDGEVDEVEQLKYQNISFAVNTRYSFVQGKLNSVISTIISSNALYKSGLLLAMAERYLPKSQNPPVYYIYELNNTEVHLQISSSANQYTIQYLKK